MFSILKQIKSQWTKAKIKQSLFWKYRNKFVVFYNDVGFINYQEIGYRMWTVSDSKLITRPTALESEGLKLVQEGCDLRKVCILTI